MWQQWATSEGKACRRAPPLRGVPYTTLQMFRPTAARSGGDGTRLTTLKELAAERMSAMDIGGSAGNSGVAMMELVENVVWFGRPRPVRVLGNLLNPTDRSKSGPSSRRLRGARLPLSATFFPTRCLGFPRHLS